MRHPSLIPVLFAGFLIALLGQSAEARQTERADQTVSVTVRPIVALAVSPAADDVALESDAAAVTAMTWAISTNGSGLELRAVLDAPLPDGVQLVVSAESGLGEGLGPVRLRPGEPSPIVTSIDRGKEKGQLIELSLVRQADAFVPAQSRTVTFTLVDPAYGTSDTVSRVVRFGSSGSPTIAASWTDRR